MKLTGLHFLLSYQCNFQCDHCFVWGSPWQQGTFTLKDVREALRQAGGVETMKWIYFEGGEPFLYYPILQECVRLAKGMGFRVGLVTNAYWATALEDARQWLVPLAGLLDDLSVSSDLFHYDENLSCQAGFASQAASELGIPLGVISVAPVEAAPAENEGELMYRGRAAAKLAGKARQRPWESFDACPYEDLREPGRIHLDPLGYLHVCQGISIGDIYQAPLAEWCAAYDPHRHPILGALVEGGPAELARRYKLPVESGYADACHLCYQSRVALRDRFAEWLLPDQMYGVYEA
ncbi:MAG: radical SAM protein [Anaerolineales bacterium]|nr:radical SAM protein [Anaerolineales bacterium]